MAYDGSHLDNSIALEQYKAVRNEIDRRSEFDLRNQRNGGIAIAVLIFFSVEIVDAPALQNLGLYLAALVALVTAIRQSNSKWYGQTLGALSKKYEVRVFPADTVDELGWEHFLTKRKETRAKWRSLTVVESYAWFGLAAALFLFALASSFGAF